jgi:hypothetical protein
MHDTGYKTANKLLIQRASCSTLQNAEDICIAAAVVHVAVSVEEALAVATAGFYHRRLRHQQRLKPKETKATQTAATIKATQTAATIKATQTAATIKATQTAATIKATQTAAMIKATQTAATIKATQTAATMRGAAHTA